MSKAGPRNPSYLRFVITGAVVGLIVGSAIAVFGDSAPDYSGGTQLGLLAVSFGFLGGLLGGLAGILLERR
ncbi:hypothetical protein [Lapillicoccus sp.]|uniref:hypothetical protein n=1 Tax=Lapillicoccus sp. TaxID=1909287 RepID=UPI0027C01730|nr:hypothetical protein [Actinomycetota bacterium]